MDDRAAPDWIDALGPDEHLVWHGRPDPDGPLDPVWRLGPVLGGVILVAGGGLVALSTTSLSDLLTAGVPFAALFLALGLALILLPRRLTRWWRGKTRYGVTTTDVIEVQSIRGRLTLSRYRPDASVPVRVRLMPPHHARVLIGRRRQYIAGAPEQPGSLAGIAFLGLTPDAARAAAAAIRGITGSTI